MIVKETNLPGLNLMARGKVRDIYDLDDKLLIVTTDRMSAFDVIMNELHPGQRQGPHRHLRLLVRAD